MAALDEPYLVTSYGINTDNARADERFKLGVTSVVYRESSKSSKTGKQQSRRAIAVNTVQGNGIHLVDVSGLCAVAVQWLACSNCADEFPACSFRINHLCRRSQSRLRRYSPAKRSPSARKHAEMQQHWHSPNSKLQYLPLRSLPRHAHSKADRGKLSLELNISANTRYAAG